MQLSSRLAVVSGQSWARCSTLYWPCGDFSAPLYLQARPLGNQLQEVKPTLSPTHTPAWVLTKPRGETFCCNCYCSHLHPAKVTFLTTESLEVNRSSRIHTGPHLSTIRLFSCTSAIYQSGRERTIPANLTSGLTLWTQRQCEFLGQHRYILKNNNSFFS